MINQTGKKSRKDKQERKKEWTTKRKETRKNWWTNKRLKERMKSCLPAHSSYTGHFDDRCSLEKFAWVFSLINLIFDININFSDCELSWSKRVGKEKTVCLRQVDLQQNVLPSKLPEHRSQHKWPQVVSNIRSTSMYLQSYCETSDRDVGRQ